MMLKLSPDVTWRELDGEIVLLENRSWRYLGVNASGAVLWRLLVDGTSRESLITALAETFELEDEVATRDVDAFLASLRDSGLLLDPATH
jgi:hypothetical protein